MAATRRSRRTEGRDGAITVARASGFGHDLQLGGTVDVGGPLSTLALPCFPSATPLVGLPNGGEQTGARGRRGGDGDAPFVPFSTRLTPGSGSHDRPGGIVRATAALLHARDGNAAFSLAVRPVSNRQAPIPSQHYRTARLVRSRNTQPGREADRVGLWDRRDVRCDLAAADGRRHAAQPDSTRPWDERPRRSQPCRASLPHPAPLSNARQLRNPLGRRGNCVPHHRRGPETRRCSPQLLCDSWSLHFVLPRPASRPP